jgi:hypothetical protein
MKMRETLHVFLSAVRRRCQLRSASRALVVGLVAGSVLCVAIMLSRPSRESALRALIVLVAGPVLGALAGFVRRPSWLTAATLVDDHYGLKDCTTSALEFADDPRPSPLATLQVLRATRRLESLHPAAVIPLRAPAGWPIAVGFLAAAIGFLSWPLVWSPVRAGDPGLLPFAPAVEEANRLEAAVRELEAMAREMPDPALDTLIDHMRQVILELKQPGLNTLETMAKLSSLEAAIAAMQRELNIGAVDQHLQSLGSALMEAGPLEPSGQALRDARFDQAANELERAADVTIDEREARAVEQHATRVAKEMQAKGLNGLSEASLKMADGVRRGGAAQRQGVGGIAREVRDHERRRRINQLMAQEQRRLQDCKDRVETRNLMEQKAKEEQAKAQSGSSKGDKSRPDPVISAKKSDDPEKPRGGLERLNGIAGQGPSEVVDAPGTSPDGPRPARRPSQKVMQKFQRLSEAALEQEPIPLGHRRSIRRYFELIRPAAGPDTATEPSAPSAGPPGPASPG